MLFTDLLPIKVFPDRVLLNVKVTPKASQDKIGTILNNVLKIYVSAVAEEGKANKNVINILAEKLNVSKNKISIEKGLTSPNKVICIYGEPEKIIEYLKTI